MSSCLHLIPGCWLHMYLQSSDISWYMHVIIYCWLQNLSKSRIWVACVVCCFEVYSCSPHTPGGTCWIYDLFMLGHFLRESSVEQVQGKLDTRPGKRLHNYMENHHFIAGKTDYSILWPCSIAFCMFTRSYFQWWDSGINMD